MLVDVEVDVDVDILIMVWILQGFVTFPSIILYKKKSSAVHSHFYRPLTCIGTWLLYTHIYYINTNILFGIPERAVVLGARRVHNSRQLRQEARQIVLIVIAFGCCCCLRRIDLSWILVCPSWLFLLKCQHFKSLLIQKHFFHYC